MPGSVHPTESVETHLMEFMRLKSRFLPTRKLESGGSVLFETKDNVGNNYSQHIDNAGESIPAGLQIAIDVFNEAGPPVGEIAPHDFARAELFVDDSNVTIIDLFFGGELSEPQDRNQIAQRFKAF